MSEINVNKVAPSTGTNVTLGDSSDTFKVPSGVTLDIESGATLDVTGATVSGLTSTTINNNADNRVITGSGTANTLNGETNLIYNGTILGAGADGANADLGNGIHIKLSDAGAVTPNIDVDDLIIESSGSCGMTILTGTSNTGGINFADSGNANAGVFRYDHANNSMDFFTNGSERVTIDSGGRTNFGAAAPIENDANVSIYGTTAYPLATKISSTGSAAQLQCFNGNGQVGGITTSGTSTIFNTSSDYRLKENETPITDGITRLKTLKPYRFNFIADADTTVDGFFAHEVSSIVPEAIVGTKDATKTRQKVVVDSSGNYYAEGVEEENWTKGKVADKDGNTQYPSDSTWEESKVFPVNQGIDQSKLVPLLVAAVKELTAKVEALENA